MSSERIILAHGNGGRFMRELIDSVFARHLNNAELNVDLDAAPLVLGEGTPYITTDGFTVKPLEFPGGNIGSLAVHGTVNDLAVAGAKPLYLTVNAFIEEGLELEVLERLIAAMASAAREAGVRVVAGDTKVVPHGEGSGLYLATTGVGLKTGRHTLGMGQIREGDTVLVSGTVGDHGTAVMLAREQFGLRGDLRSDAASVYPLCAALYDLPGLRFLRDPTRGGVATVAHEIARVSGQNVRLRQPDIPINGAVETVCEMLGYDPLFLACEGRVVAIVGGDEANTALSRWHALEAGSGATIIGHIEAGNGKVILETELGGERLLDELEDDPLPRIC